MSRSVAPPASRRRLVLLLVLVTLIGGSAAVCQVWTRLRAIHYGYRISEATRQQVQLLEANRRLRLEAALLASPQQISKAVEELGLRPPAPEQIRRLRWGQGPRARAASGHGPEQTGRLARAGR
jgi:cell division protein FtsL